MVAVSDNSLKDRVKDRLDELGMNIQDLSKATGIPADRMYKWYRLGTNPKSADATTLEKWLASVENSDKNPSRDELGPSYRTQLWYGKIMEDEFFVPFVPLKARAGYSKNYESVDFIKELETYQMPPGMKHRGAEWRWFEVGGDSMEPVLYSGDMILCSLVPFEDWRNLEDWLIYVVVTEKEIWIKRLSKVSPEMLAMISENEESYPQMAINTEDIREIWKVRRQLNAKLPPTKKFKLNIKP